MTDLSLNILLQAQDVSASSVMSAVGSAAQNLASGNMLGAVGVAAAAVGTAIVGIGAASATMAAQYRQSMNMVQALTGSSNQQMQQNDSNLKTLAVDAGVAPTALSQGLYNVISSGRSGADAMSVLTLATEDAKIGMTDATTTTDALTNVLNSFSVKAADTTRVNGEMLQTVTLGKSTFAQYATTIVNAASASVQFGVSMETMNAAWATLTSSGISAAHATTDYEQSLKVMYGNIGTVSKSLESNGIAFNEAKFNAMDYGSKVVYLNSALDQARAKHVSITGATIQASQAIQTISQHIGVYNSNLAALSDKQAMAQKTAQAWAITQGGFNQQMSQLQASIQVAMISIGNSLLPVLGQMVGGLSTVVTNFSNWETHTHAVQNAAQMLSGVLGGISSHIAQVTSFVQHNQMAMDALKGTLVAVAIVIGVALVAAFYAWAAAAWTAAAGVIAATWPILAIAAAIGILVAAFLWLYNNVAPFRNFMNQIGAALTDVWNVIVKNVTPAFQQFGSFLSSSFAPIGQQMILTWQTQMVPAWNNLLKAIQPIMPALQLFAQVIGGVVGAAVLLVTGLIGAAIGALGGFFSGLVVVFGGIVTFVGGAVQVISGIIAFFVDLCTGNFNNLGTDLSTIWNGILQMFYGIWQAIEGVFIEFINTIIGLVNGFVAGVLGPINAVLSAAHQATISVGQIPMLSVSGGSIGVAPAAPAYKPVAQHKATTAAPSTALPSIAAQHATTTNTTTPVSIPASSLAPVTGAINTASGNASASSVKSQQAAQVAAMRVADTLSKATATSGSSQVQALVAASHQATAQGNTALASYDAGKAATLANQQKAAAAKAASASAKAARAATTAANKAAKTAASLAAKAAKASASQKKHATALAAAAQKHAQVLAAHAAKLTQSASHHKALIAQLQQSTTQVIAQQCPGGVSAIPTALGVALPNYATGTGYVQNAPVTQQAPVSVSGGSFTVHIHTDSKDPKEHGKQAAEEMKKHLAKKLRGQGIAPRFTSGGTR